MDYKQMDEETIGLPTPDNVIFGDWLTALFRALLRRNGIVRVMAHRNDQVAGKPIPFYGLE